MSKLDELRRQERQAEADVTYWTIRVRELEKTLELARRSIINRTNDAEFYRQQAGAESARINAEVADILGEAA